LKITKGREGRGKESFLLRQNKNKKSTSPADLRECRFLSFFIIIAGLRSAVVTLFYFKLSSHLVIEHTLICSVAAAIGRIDIIRREGGGEE